MDSLKKKKLMRQNPEYSLWGSSGVLEDKNCPDQKWPELNSDFVGRWFSAWNKWEASSVPLSHRGSSWKEASSICGQSTHNTNDHINQLPGTKAYQPLFLHSPCSRLQVACFIPLPLLKWSLNVPLHMCEDAGNQDRYSLWLTSGTLTLWGQH
jgi:hypothetical protein